MRQAQINVRTRACSRTSIARTKQAALTHNLRGKELISSISKLAMCNPWSCSASNYSEIFSDNNGRGTLCPSDIGNKWKANVSVARMNDVHILREMIEIRDGFKECCILSKEDVSDIIDNLTVFLTYIIYIFFFYHVPLYFMMCDNKDFIIIIIDRTLKS